MIIHILLRKHLRIFPSEEFVQMLPGIRELLGTGDKQRKIGVIDDTLKGRHLVGHDCRSDNIAHKQQLRITVVDDVMNLLCIEFMENRHCYGTISQRGKERHSPVGTVSAAHGNLVAFLHTTFLKKNMQFLNLTRHVFIL